MGRNRFPKPMVDRYDISDGDWIELKRDLNNGETRQLENAGAMHKIVDGRVWQVIDWVRHDIDRALVFLTQWSIQDEDGQPVPISFGSLAALDPDTMKEINEAIVVHVVKRVAAKKSQRETETVDRQKVTTSASPAETTDSIVPSLS